MRPEKQSRDLVSSLILIVIVVMMLTLIGMTLAAGRVLAMPYAY